MRVVLREHCSVSRCRDDQTKQILARREDHIRFARGDLTVQSVVGLIGGRNVSHGSCGR